MARFFLKLLSVFLLLSCSDTTETQRTELITDSYFFQKNIFNMNLYNCNTPSEEFDSTYKKSKDLMNFYKFSEIVNQDQPKDNCIQIYAEISELTPLKDNLLLGENYMEISSCSSKVDQDVLLESLTSYLNFIKDNDVRVWTGISALENNNFYWINIWESEVYREQFLAKWIKSNNSGIFARALSSSAVCKNPSTYLYN